MEQEVAEYDVPLRDAPTTVLDIGANIGAFTLRASKMWPDSKIYAYEPMPENAKEFRANCGNGRVVLTEAAVRSFSGKDAIFIGKRPALNSFRTLGEQTAQKQEVECVDAATLPDAEFIKIDTEGCEVEILNKLNLGQARAIAVEYHTEADQKTISTICQDAGFELYRRQPHWKGNGTMIFVRGMEQVNAPKKKLFIGIPIYGGVDPNFMLCLMKLVSDFSVSCVVRPCIGDSLVSRARNSLTREFLDSDCTHFLQIDSDLVFSNEHIKRILSHDEDIVGGFYPKKKQGDVELVCNSLSPQPPMDSRRLTPLKYIGTGFLCVSRRVFEKMIDELAEDILYVSDSGEKRIEYDFWKVGVYKFPDGTRRYLSEDWYFCQKALDLGFTVWGDNGVLLRHSGHALYPLKTQESQIFSKSPATAAADMTAGADSPLTPAV